MRNLVEVKGDSDWKLVANYFFDRSDIQCQHRWCKVLNPNLVKGAWTKEVSMRVCVPTILKNFVIINCFVKMKREMR